MGGAGGEEGGTLLGPHLLRLCRQQILLPLRMPSSYAGWPRVVPTAGGCRGDPPVGGGCAGASLSAMVTAALATSLRAAASAAVVARGRLAKALAEVVQCLPTFVAGVRLEALREVIVLLPLEEG